MSSEQSLGHEQFMDLPPVKPQLAKQEQGAADSRVNEEQKVQSPEASQSQHKATQQPQKRSYGVSDSTQTTSAVSQTQAQPHSASLSMPQIADDSDLIEKEWVEKAQEIIARTKDDPHTQSKALGKIKSEYLKKRFDKETKDDSGAK